MKKITLLFVAFLALAGLQSFAQTVDEIVNKHIEAMGGKEKIAKLKTVKMTGSTSTPAGDIPVTLTKTHMVGMRTDFEYNGQSYYQVANTKGGVVLQPGMADATEMDADTYKSFSNQMDLQGALIDYKEKGSTVELVGTEKVDGAEAYNLKVTFKNGRVANYFIDKKTNRIIKSSGKTTMQGQEMEMESTFSDFKQNADGYWFPYTIGSNLRGPIVFEKIETNITVDEKLYAN